MRTIIVLLLIYLASAGLSPADEMQRQSPRNVLLFKPQSVDTSWKICIAKVDKIVPRTKSSAWVQDGTVRLKIIKTLVGTESPFEVLSYVYNQDSLYNKTHKVPPMRDDYVWPELDDLKKPYLLVVIDPAGYDPYLNTESKNRVAALVEEIDGESDPKVLELMKEIPATVNRNRK